MKITEIFESIQGEGPNIGIPAIFIRTFGCNLRCSFCDTKYSYDNNDSKEMNIEEIVEELKKYPNVKHIVITGGEPMLQFTEIEKLIEKLEHNYIYKHDINYKFELETNGILWNHKILGLFDYISISPKKDCTLHEYAMLQDRKKIFKFVIEDDESFVLWNDFIKRNKISPSQVYLMPESTTREEFIERSPHLIKICIKHGYRFAPRLHLMIWSKKRGV